MAETQTETVAPQEKPMTLYTASRARTFRSCPRKHWLRYIEGWQSTRQSEALRFGTLYHLGQEALWKGDDPLAAVAGRGVDGFEQAKVEELLRGYVARWPKPTEEYEVLGVETPFETALINPNTWKHSRTFRFAGKMDSVIRKDGRVMVKECKTSSEDIQDPAAPYWARLCMDPQVSAYVIGAESLGHAVTDTLYDVAYRPQLRPLLATPEEKRSYKKDGTLYANQRDRDETPEEYRARVRAAIEAEPEKYYQRRIVPRLESQIREFMEDSWMTAAMMRESERTKCAPRNPSSCFLFGQCEFWNICSTGGRPEDFPEEYVKSGNVNPELMEV